VRARFPVRFTVGGARRKSPEWIDLQVAERGAIAAIITCAPAMRSVRMPSLLNLNARTGVITLAIALQYEEAIAIERGVEWIIG
jgi:hypothetical protein